ncbi:SDR family oxidoreductase [Rhodococcus globerulus]|uniref:SDR family oxidoreductase n=1 Tax=Rhodococcus globerulus TaxID=33008 RepID=UPI000527C229|nr:SDR family oxidoreductase [Rhodococcus globerulus]PVX59524.1 3-oxoacyl-[acyl-carrier protein] reductase [Rhodococcus globerulus]
MDLGLTGKTALVTAASRGIGRAVAERLAAEGMTVVATSRSGDGTVETVADGRIVAQSVDLGDPDRTGALIDDVVAQFGALDTLVMNTPGPPIKPVLATTWEDWETAHDTLLRPVVQLVTRAADVMAAGNGGTIILLTSTWVKQPKEGGALSAAYRAAAGAMLKTLSNELAAKGVRMLQVMPGATGTDRMTKIVEAKASANGSTVADEISKVVAEIPLGRWAEADEIADVVAFAASARSSFMTGSAITVDGGAVRTVF